MEVFAMAPKDETQIRRIAVTGGAGFIGSHTTEALVECGIKVLVIDDYSRPCGHDLPSEVDVLEADCGSEEAADGLSRFKPDAVLHLAAKGGVARALRDPGAHVHAGLASTVSFFRSSCEAGARRIVTASSGGTVYGEASVLPAPESLPPAPRSPYGAGKLSEEVYLGAFSVHYGVTGMPLRYANVYGPRQDGTGEAGVVAISCWKLLSGEHPIIFGDGRQSRDFVFVEDVAAANVSALFCEASGPVNVGTGVDTSIIDVVETLCALADWEAAPQFGPARAGEVQRTCLDNSRAKDWLGWSPQVPISEGLARTKDYFDSRAIPVA
jgi:UDP-glucose 4-epimerase